MICFEGQPLRYYWNPPFLGFYDTTFRMEEELSIPQSPNSAQSDSDNSLSSIEVSPKPIRARTVIQHTAKTNEVRCCWKSCGEYFQSLDQLANHVTQMHSSSGPGGLFYCGWEGCARDNRGFNARYKMLVHVRTHTNEKPHQCYQCDKSFSRAENLKIHSRSHSGEKPYVCTVPGCNKAYSNSSDRFKHTRTHQVEKPYKCKVPGCPKKYTDPSSLRKHVKTYKHYVEQKAELKEKQEQHPCDCTHMCCAKKADIYRMAPLNCRQEETWPGFYNNQKDTIYVPYRISKEDSMEVDTPLDLSINSRKTI